MHVGAPIGYRPLFASLHMQTPIGHMGFTGAPVGITCTPLPHVGAPMASEASLLHMQAFPLLSGGAPAIGAPKRPMAFIGLFGMWASL